MRRRPFNPDDLERLVALINGAALGGEAELEAKTAAAFAAEIAAPGIAPARDLRVWCGGGGAIVGFGRVRVEAVGREHHGRLHLSIAAAADAGLEAEIVRWAARRLVEAAPDGAPVRLVHGVGVRDPGRADRLVALGFVPYRIKLDMGRRTAEPPNLALPEGFVLRACRGVDDAAAYVDAHNDAFVDAHDFAPLTVAELVHDIGGDHYRADRDLILEDEGGVIAGFCYVVVEAGLGYIGTLGVRRPYRRRGLAGGLLAAALRKLRDDGVADAHLHVDADSLTGATRLYQRLGFAVRFAETRLSLDNAAVREIASQASQD